MSLDSDSSEKGGECPTTHLAGHADPALTAKGWVRRNVADSDRASEVIELYRSLGFDVRVEPLRPADFGPQCQGCVLSACKSYLMIYTRKGTGGDPRPA